MPDSAATTALKEIEHLKHECTGLLQKLRTFHPVTQGDPYPEMYRLLVVPLLYSVWERCFTLCHSIALRLLRDSCATPRSMSASERAVWLIRAPFYQSLIETITRQAPRDTDQKPKKSHYSALCDFLAELDGWHSTAFDATISTAELVMTFANVNPVVVEINAKAVGIWQFMESRGIKLGRLHDLVGRRNEIGHGAVIAAPANEDFLALWEFAEALVVEYCDVFHAWISSDPRFQASENV
jgi:hypothetical protein